LQEIKDSYLVIIANKTRELFDIDSEIESIFLINSINHLKVTTPSNVKYILDNNFQNQIRNVLSI
jgi:hypothetical protein